MHPKRPAVVAAGAALGAALLVSILGSQPAVRADPGRTAAVPAGVPGGLPQGLCAFTPDLRPNPDIRYAGMPSPLAETAGSPLATLTTNRGVITVALDPAAAPCAVHSFRFLAGRGYYDGSACHRMLDSDKAGVLQCGDPSGTGGGGPGYEFGDENLDGATYPRGVLAMANRGPNTNGSQFFLVFRDSEFAPDYTPFGTVTAGLPVLDAAAADGTFGAQQDRPRTKVVLEQVTVGDGGRE